MTTATATINAIPMTKSAKPVDVRVAALRRFAIAISVLNILGHTVLGFEQSWAHPFVSIFTAYAMEILLELVNAWSNRQKPNFLIGGWVGFIDFLLPAHISGLAVAMLLYPGERFWPTVFAASVAITSKYIFRAPMGKGKGTRHFLNPSNLGITATLFLFPAVGLAPGYHFTENVTGVFDWALPMLIILTGSLLNGLLTKKFPLIFGWLGGFVLQALLRHFLFGSSLIAALTPMTGLAFVLFTFYMITDPGTTPFPPRAQVGFGLAVALLYGVLAAWHLPFSLFIALTLVCTMRGINLHLQAWLANQTGQPTVITTALTKAFSLSLPAAFTTSLATLEARVTALPSLGISLVPLRAKSAVLPSFRLPSLSKKKVLATPPQPVPLEGPTTVEFLAAPTPNEMSITNEAYQSLGIQTGTLEQDQSSFGNLTGLPVAGFQTGAQEMHATESQSASKNEHTASERASLYGDPRGAPKLPSVEPTPAPRTPSSSLQPTAIAIVGLACEYPDAHSPIELWENVLSQRRAFRPLPPERLGLDYRADDPHAPDKTYVKEAAVIEGYEFDRVKFRVAGSTFRSTDLVHWLALDVASRALEDAGFADGVGLPKENTGVIIGNTLNGEFTRAGLMRLRWPYVQRVVDAALQREGWQSTRRATFLQQLESEYKAPFPTIGEESLAGGLANTIAGRICNYFDLKGGGYTVDGACASSLLAATTACSQLVAGDIDVALIGGVDLSLDPFELVGFAKTGALAPEEMRVFDAHSAGFWPGEGCGMAVLMRADDARAQGRRIYALIRGWGVSSDGSGGITRPEVDGQLLAFNRAYRRAGFGPDSVGYFEGHGTGTAVGDATELQTIARARRAALENPAHTAGEQSKACSVTIQNPKSKIEPAVIGSIKANIGHTKAAAGVAGLIKATLALHTQTLPPTTGTLEPHAELTGDDPMLRVLATGEPWPSAVPLRAAVSAMGFGGINTHLVLEGVAADRASQRRRNRHGAPVRSSQDTELVLLAAKDGESLVTQIERLLPIVRRISRAELIDLSAELARTLKPGALRAAIVVSTPAELANRLEQLQAWVGGGETHKFNLSSSLFLSNRRKRPAIGFVFPGQGAPTHLGGGAWSRRFAEVAALYGRASLPDQGEGVLTSVAQPAIVTATLAGLQLLARFDIEATVGIGHSLGELSALSWAGVFDEATLRRVARVRGQAMADLRGATGTMASIGVGLQQVQTLMNGAPLAIACLNAPNQTVVAGEDTAVQQLVRKAVVQGLSAKLLAVSHAFHSPLVAAAAPVLAAQLAQETLQPLQNLIISTVTGVVLHEGDDLRHLLTRQITEPVRFTEALDAAPAVDLWLEVGPGRTLNSLVAAMTDAPVISLDAGGPALKGLLQAVGAAFVLGAPVNQGALFAERFTKPFDLHRQLHFFTNPCELAPQTAAELTAATGSLPPLLPTLTKSMPVATPQTNGHHAVGHPAMTNGHASATNGKPISTAVRQEQHPPLVSMSPLASQPAGGLTLATIRELVATRAELPLTAVRDGDRLLSDLHLNSISVGQLVAEAARRLQLAPPIALTDYANVTVADVAQALDDIAQQEESDEDVVGAPSGVASWVRAFTVELIPEPLPAPQRYYSAQTGAWQVIAPAGHPLATRLQAAAPTLPGNGLLLCLPAQPHPQEVGRWLEAAQIALAQRDGFGFVLVQQEIGAAALARTLHLEMPKIATAVVNVPFDQPDAVKWVVAEATAAQQGYTEAHYDRTGTRRAPRLHRLAMTSQPQTLPLGAEDVLLVTGGGKGITAECALALAQVSGCRLALLGRAQPTQDAELAANLQRMSAAGVTWCYVAADVVDRAVIQQTVGVIEKQLGPITAILHGAARNAPKLLSALTAQDFQETFAPKLQGLENLLAAVDASRLRLLVTFGSIIARTGMAGEADYGLANEWLAQRTAQFQQEHPHCRALCIEWSVWEGAGMGAKLGRLEALIRQGITPIPIDDGVNLLQQLLAQPATPAAVVVTGRFGDAPTLKLASAELPFWRFLEETRVHYPGIELVVDATLGHTSDPYLADHVFRGEPLFLAVLGLEAMAQVAMALTGQTQRPTFTEVQFLRPIVVPVGEGVRIRLAGLVGENGEVAVALRSAETGFQVDHFHATCQFAQPAPLTPQFPPSDFPLLRLNPQEDLYGGVFFHQGRFMRVEGYRDLAARHCVAQISPTPDNAWFDRYLPQTLVLGDPGVRDAVIHAIQVCVPHGFLLPVGVERLVFGASQISSVYQMQARERSQAGDRFVYDVEVTNESGALLERWEGLQLQRVSGMPIQGDWVASLLGPYLTRSSEALNWLQPLTVAVEVSSSQKLGVTNLLGREKNLPGRRSPQVIEKIVEVDENVERQERSNLVMQRALGTRLAIHRRPDGAPEAPGSGRTVSAAHAGSLTLAVAGVGPVGCDVEAVTARERHVWQDLLGVERYQLANLLVQEGQITFDSAATQLWSAVESMRKAGIAVTTPLLFEKSQADGWVLFKAGGVHIATCQLAVRSFANPLVFALATGVCS